MLKDNTLILRIIPLILYTLFVQYEIGHINWLRSFNNSNLELKRKKERIL